MKVGLIAADEKRDRQKFISRPLINEGHQVSVIKTRPFSSYLLRLYTYVAKRKPDIIICMGVGVKELLALIIIKLFNVPFVLRLGGDPLRDLESVANSFWRCGRYVRWLKFEIDFYITRYFLKKMEMVIVVNEALGSRISPQLKPEHRIYIIPQYCEGPSVPKEYHIETPVKLLTVTNFIFSEKAKGVIWLIEQLNSFVSNNGVALHFCVVGGGMHLKDVKNYLKSMRRTELLSVELVGFVSDLDKYYRAADVFLYHSYHDATPNVILESKRYGLPLLANDCDEFRSIVAHDVSGLLYRNDIDFSLLLNRLCIDKSLRDKIGRNALLGHETLFSISSAQDKLQAAILSIIEHPH